MSDQKIILNHIPKLSNNTCAINIVYDRDKKGFVLQIERFRPDEEQLFRNLVGQVGKILTNPSFFNDLLLLKFRKEISYGCKYRG